MFVDEDIRAFDLGRKKGGQLCCCTIVTVGGQSGVLLYYSDEEYIVVRYTCTHRLDLVPRYAHFAIS